MKCKKLGSESIMFFTRILVCHAAAVKTYHREHAEERVVFEDEQPDHNSSPIV